MAKKAQKSPRIDFPVEIHTTIQIGDNLGLVRRWAEDHACDRFTIREVDKDKFRVNLYTESGDTIRISHLSRSFYLVVADGVIEDKTIKGS
jgi:hypothetical protein